MKAGTDIFAVQKYNLGENEPFLFGYFFYWVSFNLDPFQNLLRDGVCKYLSRYTEDNCTEVGG